MRGHGHLAPVAGTALDDLLGKHVDGGRINRIFRCHFAVRRPDDAVFHFMTGKAVRLGNEFQAQVCFFSADARSGCGIGSTAGIIGAR